MSKSQQKIAIDTLPRSVIDGVRTAVSISGKYAIRECAERYSLPLRTVRAVARSLVRMPSRGGEDDGASERVLDAGCAAAVDVWANKPSVVARAEALAIERARHKAWKEGLGIAEPVEPVIIVGAVEESQAWLKVAARAKAAGKSVRRARREADKYSEPKRGA